MLMLCMIIRKKEREKFENYNYGKTNQTFSISADNFGSNLYANIKRCAFSANLIEFLCIRVN